MKQVSLSPSKLNVFNDCPRCFWDANTAKVPKPRGIMASLPGGMDLIMKDYVDQFRGKLPPGLEGRLPGALFADQERMKKWRYWGTGPTYFDNEHQIKLIGALDDCLVDGDIYIPLDWKTKGSEPDDDGSQYYQTQLDCYNLMLEAQGLKVRDEGWLVYIYPELAMDNSQIVRIDGAETHTTPLSIQVIFGLKPFKLECSRERAKEIVIKAAECLRGPRPKSSLRCEHCQYLALEDELTQKTEKGVVIGA